MGRKKKLESNKKQTISVTIDYDILIQLDDILIKSKSKLINSLLKEYLNTL